MSSRSGFRTGRIAKRFQRDLPRPAPRRKINSCRRRANHRYDSRRLIRTRGVAHVTNAGWDAVDATASGAQTESQGGSSRERSAGARTNDAATRLRQALPGSHEVQRSPWRGRSRTAKSCGPGAPMLASSFAEMYPPNRAGCIEDLRSDGGKKAGHRGEPEVSRNPSRRESRFDPVEPVVISCASCAHDRGCNRHPAFPAPSALLGGRFRSKPRALRAAGRRTHILWMHI